MLNHSANISIIKCRKNSCQDITCKLDKRKHLPQCIMQARSLIVSVFHTEVWVISEEGERAGLAVCSFLCKRTYCLELRAAWSWAWSTGCASSPLAADGAATAALFITCRVRWNDRKINPWCTVQMVAQCVTQVCALSRSRGTCCWFYGVILCGLSSL